MRAIVAAPVSGGDEGGGDALHVFAVDAEAVAGVFVVQPVEDGRGVEAAVDEGVAAGEGAPQVFCRVFGNADEARGQAVAVVVATGREGGAQGGLCGGGVGQVDVDVGEAAAGVGVQPGDDVAAQGFALALQAVAAVDAQAVVLWCLVVRVCRCAVFTPPPRPSPALRGRGGCGKVGGNVVFFEFADFGLQGGEEVVRRGGRGREWFGVAVGVEEAGEVALLFAVAGEEFVSVFAVFAAWFSGGARFEFAQPAAVNDVVDVAVAGGEVGYQLGARYGRNLFKDDAKFLSTKNLHAAEEFFAKRGGVALVLGRFVPIVRTFVSLAAGISSYPRRKFNLWNILGAVLWIGLIGTAGVLLGGIEFVHKNIELLAVIIVLVSVVPVAIEYIRGRKKEQKALSE